MFVPMDDWRETMSSMYLTDGLAIAALTVSLLLAVWEVMKFRREGAWVRVTLKPGLYDGSMLRTMNMRVPEDSELYGEKGMRFDLEVGIIEVENRGRTPVTVRGVTLEFERQRWPRRKTSQSYGFPFIEFQDAETKSRVRIDAFDSVTFIIDACHALPAIKARKAEVAIKAVADVAGRKPVRSSRRTAWRFAEKDRPWLFEIGTFDLARQVYRSLAWRVRSDMSGTLMLPDFAMKVAEQVEAGSVPTQKELEKLVRGEDGDHINLRLATFDLARELLSPDGGILDGSGIARRRLARGPAAPT